MEEFFIHFTICFSFIQIFILTFLYRMFIKLNGEKGQLFQDYSLSVINKLGYIGVMYIALLVYINDLLFASDTIIIANKFMILFLIFSSSISLTLTLGQKAFILFDTSKSYIPKFYIVAGVGFLLFIFNLFII